MVAGGLVWLAACALPAQSPSEAPPSSAPSATPVGVRACQSTLTSAPEAPEPVAPPDALTVLPITGRVDLPGESAFVGASEDALWITSTDGWLWRVDVATQAVTNSIELPDLGLSRPASGLGAIWVAEMASGRLLRLDPLDGSTIAEIALEPSERPLGIAFDIDSVWVANQTSNSVIVVDGATNEVVERIDMRATSADASDRAPSSISTGAMGAWVVEHRADALAAIDGQSWAVTRTCIGTPEPGIIVAAADLLWVSDSGGVVSVIDPATGSPTARLGIPGVVVGDLVADDEMIWVAAGSHVVGIKLSTRTVTAIVALGDLAQDRQFAGGVSIAETADAVWTTDPASDGLLRLGRAPASP